MVASMQALAAAFNEWQRRFIEEPDLFKEQWASIKRTLQERADGVEPSYGANCASYLESLLSEALPEEGPAPVAEPGILHECEAPGVACWA